ncbi:MAG TPA: dihydrofolate reductase family protein [Thermomicrobiales bacterium]|nr:dihydrofolate reductase family protein [Thermomicrobiales bacterium]
MGKVIFDMSMSLDGYVRASNATPEEPLGVGGERLHDWAFGEDEGDRGALSRAAEELGAIITGRRNYDDSIPWWGADGPTGPARLPVFVVTHRPPDTVPAGSVYTFVTDGIERALEQAKIAAGGKDVAIMGGPNIGCQFMKAGLVDEIGVHLVPVLFGNGLRMFEHLGDDHIHLEPVDVVSTARASHLRYRIVG